MSANYFLSGGRTGDLIHNLMAIKQLGNADGNNVLFLTDQLNYGGDSFHYNIDRTINDLSPFLLRQSYIREIKKLIDPPPPDIINLNRWRSSPFLFKHNWMKILQATYNIPPINKWIEADVLPDFQDKTVIHRSVIRHNPEFPWEQEIGDDCIFVTLNPVEYDRFPFKKRLPMHLCSSFLEMVNIINSSKRFIGNMSTPLAIAHALDHPRLAELYHTDQMHYIGEEEISKHFKYVQQKSPN